jgi:hypothetical protein
VSSSFKNSTMKKNIFFALLLTLVSSGAFAMCGPGTPEKIKESFHHKFPQIENPEFFDLAKGYEVYFQKDHKVFERVYLDVDGEITETIKYYTEEALDPLVRQKINKTYKGKAIFGITEIQSNTEHFYRMVLQDNKHWYIITSDATGRSVMEEKLDKSS